MKVALAHDFLIRWGGAEKVLLDLCKIFPEAPIFTLFYKENFVKKHFPMIEIKTTRLQEKYRKTKNHHLLTPLMPITVEDLDFSRYDLVISSTSGFMKGIVVPSKTKHICYMHTPTRWVWQDYFLRKPKALKRLFIHFFRLWDFEASQRPDLLITNSYYSAKRIKKFYRRDAKVIYPAISDEIVVKSSAEKKKNYYVIVSRLSDYKNVDKAIEVFKTLNQRLVIVGDGPEKKKLIKKSKKFRKQVIFTGFIQKREKLLELIKNSKGLIHLAEEDFGLVMAEALKMGIPVIAWNRGGAEELIQDGVNGILFSSANEESIKNNLSEAIERSRCLEKSKISLKKELDLSLENFKKELFLLKNKKYPNEK